MIESAYFTEAGETTADGAVIAPASPTVESGHEATSTPEPVAASPAVAPILPVRDELGRFVSPAAVAAPVTAAEAEPAPAATKPPAEAEAKARETGWKPLEEWQGDPRKWVPAEAWVANQPLVDQLRASRREIREKNKAIEAAQQHYARVHEAAYQRAMQELTAQKDQAIVEQDRDRVYEIERQMAQVNAERAKAPVLTPVVDPAYTQFAIDHPEIKADPQMAQFAIAYEKSLAEYEPDIDKRLDETLAAVRVRFPDRFKNQRRQAPAMVEGTATGAAAASNAPKKFSEADLSPMERSEMQRLVRAGVLTQADYLRDIQAYNNRSFAV